MKKTKEMQTIDFAALERKQERQRSAQMCSAWALDSTNFAWDNRWGAPLEAAAAGAFAGDNVNLPPSPDIFQQARRWYRLHPFVRSVINLKLGFHNFGLLGELRLPVNPKKPDGETATEWHPGIRAVNEKDGDKIRKWKAANRLEIARVTMDSWMSHLQLRNTVTLWRKTGRLIIYRPEACKFKDAFGMEELTITHGLTDTQINAMEGLSVRERQMLKASPNLKLTHDNPVFFFKVLKEETMGMGFGWPDLATVFHACSLNEALLVGDRQLADACRTVYEQHKLGHEIRSGNNAGNPAHFMKDKRAKGVKDEIKSKKGHIQMATNFDHVIEIGAGRPKPEQYETKRYAQTAEQLATWGMPYGHMLNGQINPFLMTLARMLAVPDRQRMGPFLSELFVEALDAPAPVTCVWSDACFWDSRLLVDLMTKGMQAGPVSGESFLRSAGLNPLEERMAKARDAALPSAMTLPLFDPNHGQAPGKGGKPGGRGDQA